MDPVEHRVPVTFDGRVDNVDLTVGQHNRIVLLRPRVRRPTPAPIESYPNAALVVPSRLNQYRHPISVILAAIHASRDASDASLILVVGLVTGDEAPGLARHRTESVRCLVENDAAAWLTLATEAGSLLEVKAYLDYLAVRRGWPCSVSDIDSTAGPSTERSVLKFQEEFNRQFQRSIYEDGTCGTQTLESMFEVLRFEWDRWLDKHGVTQSQVEELEFVYASGGSLPADMASLEPLGGLAGVDLVVLRKADLMGAEATPELIYGSQTARWGTFDVPVELGEWEFGTYTIVTDLEPDEADTLETYRLLSTDGSWASELEVGRDGVADGLVELQFTDVPCDKRYGLSVELDGVGRYTLFEDLAYSDFHRVAAGELDPGRCSASGGLRWLRATNTRRADRWSSSRRGPTASSGEGSSPAGRRTRANALGTGNAIHRPLTTYAKTPI